MHYFCAGCGCAALRVSPAFELDGKWDGKTRGLGAGQGRATAFLSTASLSPVREHFRERSDVAVTSAALGMRCCCPSHSTVAVAPVIRQRPAHAAIDPPRQQGDGDCRQKQRDKGLLNCASQRRRVAMEAKQDFFLGVAAVCAGKSRPSQALRVPSLR